MANSEIPAEEQLFPVPGRLLDAAQCPKPWVSSLEQYKDMHRQSIENPDEFFGKVRKTAWKRHGRGIFTCDGLAAFSPSFSVHCSMDQRSIGSMEAKGGVTCVLDLSLELFFFPLPCFLFVVDLSRWFIKRPGRGMLDLCVWEKKNRQSD